MVAIASAMSNGVVPCCIRIFAARSAEWTGTTHGPRMSASSSSRSARAACPRGTRGRRTPPARNASSRSAARSPLERRLDQRGRRCRCRCVVRLLRRHRHPAACLHGGLPVSAAGTWRIGAIPGAPACSTRRRCAAPRRRRCSMFHEHEARSAGSRPIRRPGREARLRCAAAVVRQPRRGGRSRHRHRLAPKSPIRPGR